MSKEVKYIRKVGDRAFLFETYEQPLRTQIKQLKQQLAKKDKEIERLKVFEKIYYQNQLQASQETINKLFQSAYQSPVAVGLNQIAIQELEKVNKYADEDFRKHCYIDAVQLEKFINQQIKDLKGE